LASVRFFMMQFGTKEEIEELRNARNICYILGGALLLGGVSIHIFF
jgi:hypothetical protein